MQPVIPWYVALIVVSLVFGLGLWLYRMVSQAAESADLTSGIRSRIRWGTAIVLGVWIVLALLLVRSSPAVDAAGNGVVPLTYPLFAIVSLGVTVGLLALSPIWRRVVDAIPADQLIGVQVFRLVGIVFLLLYAMGRLPGDFALPAGGGDVAVGLLAPLVALAVRRQGPGARALALGWNLFGFLDLVIAVGLGTGYLFLALQPELNTPPGTAAMTFFPLALIPTYVVPLAFTLHVYSIRRTLKSSRSKSVENSQIGSQRMRATAPTR